MATRFYFQESESAEISPAYTGDWGRTSCAKRRKLYASKQSTAFGTDSYNVDNCTPSGSDLLFRQYVSGSLVYQTISGTAKGQVRISTDSSNPTKVTFTIKVVSQDGSTVRGTLASYKVSNTSTPPASLTNRKFLDGSTTPITLSSVTAQRGDRIVIEVGIKASQSNKIYSMEFGDNSGTDLPEDETDTNQYNPWIEFSGTITFLPAEPKSQPTVKINSVEVDDYRDIELIRGVSKRFDKAKIQIINKAGAKTSSYSINQDVEVIGSSTGIKLDGSTGYVNVPHSASLNLEDTSDDISVFAFVKTTGTGTHLILSKIKNVSGTEYGFYLSIQSGQVNCYVLPASTGAQKTLISDQLVNDGAWHMVGFTYTGSTATIEAVYIDGYEVTGTSGSASFGASAGLTSGLEIGRRGGGFNDRYLPGYVHDISVWGRVLTDAEVLGYYRDKSPVYIDQTNLRGHWALRQNANDSSGYANNGTANGTYSFYDENTITLFKGRLVSTAPQDRDIIEVIAEDFSAILGDREASDEFTNKTVNYAITDGTYGLMPKYLSSITLNNVTSVSKAITKKFDRVTILEALTYLADISHANGFDFYVDRNKDLHYFQARTIDSQITLKDSSRSNVIKYHLPYDGSQIFNKITVVGATLSPILNPISYTSNDATSQSSYGVREMPTVVDPTILTPSEAQDKADRLITRYKDPYRKGTITVKSDVCELIRPGDLVTVNISGSGVGSAQFIITDMKLLYPKRHAELHISEYSDELSGFITEMLKDLRRANIRSIYTNSNTLVEEYTNHLGTVDNYLSTSLSGGGTVTTVGSDHRVDIDSGLGAGDYAILRSKDDLDITSHYVIGNFLWKGHQIGQQAGADRGEIFVGFEAAAASDERWFTYDVVSGNWYAESYDGGTTQETQITAPSAGDLLTIVAQKDRTYYYLNNDLVAVHNTVNPSNNLRMHIEAYNLLAATTSTYVRIDLMSLKVYRI